MKITRVIGTAGKKDCGYGCEMERDYIPDEVILQEKSGPIVFSRGNAASGENADGSSDHILLIQEGWELSPVEVRKYIISEDTQIETRQTADGERTFVENAQETCIARAYQGKLCFAIKPSERIFGLGQHEEGISSYRNCAQYLYQNNMKIPMPVFLSTEGYAVLLDADCLMIYEEHGNRITISFDAVDQISYFLIEGDTPGELMRGIRKITGKAPLLPLWAYGYVQSRERYCSQKELLETAEEFERRNIPVSCLVQDWQTWEYGKWGNKRLDRSRYPDLKQATDQLHEKGIGLLLSIWPNMAQGCPDNEEMQAAGLLLADSFTYDAFREEARELYWKQCERELFAEGVDAWWCDSTEPFTLDWSGTEKLGAEERYFAAKEAMTKFMDARKANTYALHHVKGMHDNQRKADPSKRVMVLSRSGSLSIQKYGAILWSGDICASWDVLKKQIVEGLQVCSSGIPYWTLDIGAFFTKPQKSLAGNGDELARPWFWSGNYEKGVEDKGYRELYVRWLQYGTFLPIMRSHGTDTPREPWYFGEPGDLYYDTIVKYIRLRYRLIPYIYSLAYQVYREDGLMMRSLFFDYPEDEKALETADQFLFGDFLVCPVTEPVEFGPGSEPIDGEPYRKVYLPEEDLWYDYETKEGYPGGQEIMAAAPVDRMPLYVRGGSILSVMSVNPEGRLDLYRTQKTEKLSLEIYGGKDGQFLCYFDSGNGYEYQSGEFAAVTVSWSEEEKKLTLSDVEGVYPYPEEWSVCLWTAEGEKYQGSMNYQGKSVSLYCI